MSALYFLAKQRELIADLNEQLEQGLFDNAHDCAVANNLQLQRWLDQSGGVYRGAGGVEVFGWEYPEPGFDDQVETTGLARVDLARQIEAVELQLQAATAQLNQAYAIAEQCRSDLRYQIAVVDLARTVVTNAERRVNTPDASCADSVQALSELRECQRELHYAANVERRRLDDYNKALQACSECELAQLNLSNELGRLLEVLG